MGERCLECKHVKRNRARGLCPRCYDRHYRAGTLDAYPTLSRGEVPHIEGISYRQLDFWVRQGYLHPISRGEGPGIRREWPEAEVEVAKRMSRLVAAHLPPRVAVEVARGRSEIAPGVRVVLADG